MLWETKQREREIKHSRVSDLPPLNTIMLLHSWVGVAGVHRVLCSLALSVASVVSPPKKETFFNTHKHLLNHLSLERGTSRRAPHKWLFFRIGNKQSAVSLPKSKGPPN